MTEREQDRLDQTRRYVYARAGYRCEICGWSVTRYGTPQLAHRIPQTVRNLSTYGKAVIHHHLNLAATCSLACNAKADIRHDRAAIEAIVDAIRRCGDTF